ncbi:MAG: hypothetical protein ACYTG0_40210, partial [Planctomycetota bacterium]
MKRFLIRMSALATVVALGLIAIAQGQRCVDNEDPSAEPPEQIGSEPGAPRQIVLAQHISPLEPLGDDRGGNPLRNGVTLTGGAPPAEGFPIGFPEHTSAERSVVDVEASSGIGDPFSGVGGVGNRVEVEVADRVAPSNDRATVSEVPEYRFGHRNLATGSNTATGMPPNSIPPIGNPVETREAAELPLTGPGSLESPSTAAPTTAAPAGMESFDNRAIERYRMSTTPSSSVPKEPGNGYDTPGFRSPDWKEPNSFELDQSRPISSIGYPPEVSAGRLSLPTADRGGRGLAASEGTGTPGNKQLEGPQTPQLTLEKFAPPEIQVGKEATFRILVTNSGRIAAHGVEIHDEIPQGTQLVDTSPAASRGAGGELVWTLGTMRPGDEASVELRLKPVREGEIGSVATVQFSADASVRTVATKPELVIHAVAPSQVLIGQQMALRITVSNPGSGVATGVMLEEHVPAGLEHPDGSRLEYPRIGDLGPNESRELILPLRAVRAGTFTNVLIATADAGLHTEDRLNIEVTAPQLDVTLDGPKRRYLERAATYTLSVFNPGTAPARNVELVAHLSEGLEFVDANNSGQYEAATRSVHWLLEELPIRETGAVQLTAMPVTSGEQVIRYMGIADPGVSIEGKQPILVEGIAAILFQGVDVDDPIEMGGE